MPFKTSFYDNQVQTGILIPIVPDIPAGYIPYITSTGLLGYSSNQLFFDSATNRIGFGTPTPGAKLQVASGGISVTTNTTSSVNPGAGNIIADGNIKASSYTKSIMVVTAAGSVTVSNTDSIIVIRKTVAEVTAITLPTGSSNLIGQEFIIKDGKGDASTNNITLSVNGGGNIDGTSTYSITSNYQAVSFVWDGTEYIAI